MMIFLFGLLLATTFAVVGFFVLYTSTLAQGGIRRFGQYLGVWLLALAGTSVLAGLYASTQDGMGRMGQHIETMHHVEEQQVEILQELLQRN